MPSTNSISFHHTRRPPATSAAPPLRSLTLRLVTFVTDTPTPAIALAVRHTRARVLVVAPPSQRGAVTRMGAEWYNMTAAAHASARWAARYRHMSTNSPAYERFCLQRWLMLRDAVRTLALPADSAIACLDSDILLFRDPARWLADLVAFAPAAAPLPQLAVVIEGAFVIHSLRTLGDFARYLEWLYAQPSATLAAEIAQHSQARPLNSVHREARHALSGSLLREFNRSAPHTFQQWSDMPAMAAFCATNAAKRSNAGLVGAHCTRAWHVGTAGDSETQAWRPNCTVHALADGGGRGFLQVLMSAERERDPDRSREGSKDAPAPLGSGTPAQRWAAAWRWRAGAPLAPPQNRTLAARGCRYRAVCLAHLQGAGLKAMIGPLAARALQDRRRSLDSKTLAS